MPRAPKEPAINGILNVNKPYGITSMEVVRRLKRASRQKRVGHGGTLDPVATGVVPICFGQATRMMEYLVDGRKEYRAEIELGATTDTYDALGKVVERRPTDGVALEDVEAAIAPYLGTVKQVPPMYSALKRQGKRLYDLARAGIEVEREPRDVVVHWTRLLDWSPPIISIEVGCGRGFYMRSLAHDVGQALGCGGHLKSLERLRSGSFYVADAVELDDAEERFIEDSWAELIYAPDAALYGLKAAIVGKRLEQLIRHGQPIPPESRIPGAEDGERCRVYGVDGAFVAVLGYDAAARRWRPEKVFQQTKPGHR